MPSSTLLLCYYCLSTKIYIKWFFACYFSSPIFYTVVAPSNWILPPWITKKKEKEISRKKYYSTYIIYILYIFVQIDCVYFSCCCITKWRRKKLHKKFLFITFFFVSISNYLTCVCKRLFDYFEEKKIPFGQKSEKLCGW